MHIYGSLLVPPKYVVFIILLYCRLNSIESAIWRAEPATRTCRKPDPYLPKTQPFEAGTGSPGHTRGLPVPIPSTTTTKLQRDQVPL